MYYTVEPDRRRVVTVLAAGLYEREADRFLVVRWANGTGTVEVDCPSQSSARQECRRLRGEPIEHVRVKGAARMEDREDARRDQLGDNDQLSLLVD